MAANLSSKHPAYTAREPDWKIMRDAYSGERCIKKAAQEYLKPTGTMQEDGMTAPSGTGYLAYEAYLGRAVYHEMVRPALEAALGVMHSKPAEIEVPPQLEDMLKSATFNGEDMQTLLQKTNEAQLLMGRVGLMLDVATGAAASALPYIVSYSTESMGNWDTSKVGDLQGLRTLELVVLNETRQERIHGLAWEQVTRYRILALAEQVDDVWPGIKALGKQYVAAEVKDRDDAVLADFRVPQLAGRALESIPFVFVGPRDLVPDPDIPPMMALARIALAIYRTEADYRQALYMQGQDTLVLMGRPPAVPGEKETTKVGAGHVIDVPLNGDAKYIGAESEGISDLRTAIQDDREEAERIGGQLLTERGNAAESGDALRIRVASRTSTLTTVAKAGGVALEQLLRSAAVWVGADPEKVKVKPNLDFADNEALAQDLVQLMSAKMLGAPISKKSIHDWMVKREFTKLTFEEEMDEVGGEEPMVAPTRGVGGPLGAGPGNAPAKDDEKPPVKDKKAKPAEAKTPPK